MSLRTFLLDRVLLPGAFSLDRSIPLPGDGFICVQAFGRNTYPDKEVGVVRTKRNELGDIATFEWLRTQNFRPGNPNVLLASGCITDSVPVGRFVNDNGSRVPPPAKPIIGQWEVMYQFWLSNKDWYESHIDRYITIWPPDKGYLRSRGLFLEAKRIADERGWKQPRLLAHPEHIQRCNFLARKIFGVRSGAAEVDANELWFDRRSVQWWTRGKWRWLLYELCLARPHHWLHGWF